MPPKTPAPKKTNRQFKSSIFAALFSNINDAVDLINALLGTNFAPNAAAQLATLENVLSCGRLNDLAVVLGNTLLVLIEHQSTINKNMTYRMLEYVVEIFKRRVGDAALYSSRQIGLLRPIFIVLYNGTAKTPARELQRLSALYSGALPPFAGLGGLELEAVVININDPANKNLVKSCKLLNEYCIFVDMIRRNQKTADFDTAFNKTVNTCIRRGVLKAFLLKHRKELFTMLVADWNWNTALKVAKKENYEMGIEAGVEIGEKKGLAKGVKKGVVMGVKKGVVMGVKKGVVMGVKKGVVMGRKEGMQKVFALLEQGCSLDEARKKLRLTRPATRAATRK